jgi:tRNA modification GTPase
MEWINATPSALCTPSIIVLTKCDLPSATLPVEIAIRTSSAANHGIAQLNRAIAQSLAGLQQETSVVGTAERCQDSLRAAAASFARAQSLNQQRSGEELIALEIRLALTELGKVVGAVYTDDILDRIFSRFCIGK